MCCNQLGNWSKIDARAPQRAMKSEPLRTGDPRKFQDMQPRLKRQSRLESAPSKGVMGSHDPLHPDFVL